MKEERKSYYVPFLAGQDPPFPRRSSRINRPFGMDAWELQLIEDHYTRTITHKELAEEACLSPSRFAVLFRRELNTTPLAYLEKYRLDRAVEMLLHSALPINGIAEMTGFHCQFYFSRVFRKRFDQSPSGFRKSGRQLTGDRILHDPLVKV